MSGVNLASILQANARNRPSHPAIEHGDRRLDYAGLWLTVASASAWLSQRGVKSGTRVGLALADTIEHVVLHFAIARLGAVLLPLDHRWTVREQSATASAMGASLVIVQPGAAPLENVPVVSLDSDFAGTDPQSLPAIPEDGELPWLISLSSGTTGRPKGAIVTHRQMYERFINQWVMLGFNAGDRFAAMTPLYFGAGRSFVLCFLVAGATVVLLPPPHEPAGLLAQVRHSRVTAAFAVPTMLRRLVPLAEAKKPAWPLLRRLVVSGEPLFPDEAAMVADRLSPRLYGYYASSEGGGISVLQPEEQTSHCGSVGRAGFRLQVRVVDDAGQVLDPGQTGRLCYRGPGVAQAFLDENGETVENNGWFFPGDLAAMDKEGYITLRGREKDVIIRGGINIYPAEIERFLNGLSQVRECAVVGVRSAQRGEEIVAYYAGDATPEWLDQQCRDALAPYKVPGRFQRLEQLPRAGSGKIDRKALAALEQST